MGKVLRTIGIVLGTIVGLVFIFFAYLTMVEYKPEAVEELEVHNGSRTISVGDTLSVLSFNIGYAAYDQDEDFFMDGGKTVRPENKAAVEANMAGIASIINEQNTDVVLLQEIDLDSKRSYNVNEVVYLNISTGLGNAFAYNFNVNYVPYPLPTIGKVRSGVAIYTDLNVESAKRIALPVAFKWPVKTCNLKRCILEERIPIEGTDKELVIMDFHLEAYDNGDGKIAQTKVLMDKLEEEYLMGNYVIAGGDFNQHIAMFEQFPTLYPDDWQPGEIDTDVLPNGYSFAVNNNAPTCRSLARPFISNEESQVYLIDGFIVSDNLQVNSVKVIDEQFMYSDHNPVRLDVRIKKDN